MQGFKHLLLLKYLQAWYPILGSSAEKLLYVETHAGKGVHDTGEYGSPLVALDAFTNHTRSQGLAGKCRVSFLLMEKDPSHVASLRLCLEHHSRPTGVSVEILEGNFADELHNALTKLETDPGTPPAFIFVDPFSYILPLNLLKRALKLKKAELLITFMTQDVVTAIGDASKNSSGKALNLEELFGGPDWRAIHFEPTWESKLRATEDLYRKAVGANWCTMLRMKGNREYALMHFTNSDLGRKEIKRAMWKVGEHANRPGEYEVAATDNPDQATLISLGTNLEPLREAFLQKYVGTKTCGDAAYDWCLESDYLEKHLTEVIKAGIDERWISQRDPGRVGPGMGEFHVICRPQDSLF